jgi:hypothetical protein
LAYLAFLYIERTTFLLLIWILRAHLITSPRSNLVGMTTILFSYLRNKGQIK